MSSRSAGGPAFGDVIKRWVNEAQEAVASDSVMVQYHALGLLYHIRKSDRLAVNKLVTKLTRSGSSVRSPYAVCMLIRYEAIGDFICNRDCPRHLCICDHNKIQ